MGGGSPREALIRSQAGSFRLAYVGKAGAEERSTQSPQPSLPPFCTASHPFPRRLGQRGDPEGRAQRKHLAGPGRAGKRRLGSSAGGRSRKQGQNLGSGRASLPAPPPHPRPSALLSSQEAVTLLITASRGAPAVSSCALPAPVTPSLRGPARDPAPCERSSGSRRDGRAREPDPAEPHDRKCLDSDRAGAANFRLRSPTSSKCADRFGGEAS